MINNSKLHDVETPFCKLNTSHIAKDLRAKNTEIPKPRVNTLQNKQTNKQNLKIGMHTAIQSRVKIQTWF